MFVEEREESQSKKMGLAGHCLCLILAFCQPCLGYSGAGLFASNVMDINKLHYHTIFY